MRWSDRDKRVSWHPFTQMKEWSRGEPLVIERGEGSFLIDTDGRRYLDGVGSLWCNLHGHANQRIDDAIRAQLERVAHSTYLGLSHPPGIDLAERLIRVAPSGLTRVFYSDSGSSAVEIALKLAFQFAQLSGFPQRRRFLHLSQGYHGDTLGAVGVGGIEVFHRIFGPIVVPGIAVPTPYVPASEGLASEAQLARGLEAVDRVLAEHGDETAAFIVEPLIQGAAGMLTHPPGYLAGVARRCTDRGIALIVDEVATGFGRTGTVFACERESVTPDFLCLAKGMTGGYLPLAATLATERIYEAFLGERRDMRHFFHGHTYTANPLACAAAIASLDLLAENLPSYAAVGARLRAALEKNIVVLPGVREIRQVGAMVGIELGPFPPDDFVGAKVCERARSHGVILRPLGDVIVWMPPLSIYDGEIELLTRATATAMKDVFGG